MHLKKNERLKQASFIISLPRHQEPQVGPSTAPVLPGRPVSFSKAQSSCKKIKTTQNLKKRDHERENSTEATESFQN